MSEPSADDPFKVDKRTDETVMISSDNLSDLVAQATTGAAPAEPAEPAAGSAAAKDGPNTAVLVAVAVAVAVVVIIAVIALAG